jgi:hypothetical protein
MPRSRIALETGMHSPWMSRLLSALGHEVIGGACAQRAPDRESRTARTIVWTRGLWLGWRGSTRNCYVR